MCVSFQASTGTQVQEKLVSFNSLWPSNTEYTVVLWIWVNTESSDNSTKSLPEQMFFIFDRKRSKYLNQNVLRSHNPGANELTISHVVSPC